MENPFNAKIIDDLGEMIFISYQQELEKLVENIAFKLEREIKQVIGEKAFDWGTLHNSVGSEVRRIAEGYLIIAFTNSKYSGWVNDGTKPHFPPIEPIYKWVKHKGIAGRYSIKTRKKLESNADVKRDKQVAFLIARSISRKGTKGVKFFEIALKQAWPHIEKEVLNFNADWADVIPAEYKVNLTVVK